MAIIQFGWPGWAGSGGAILYAAFKGRLATPDERMGPIALSFVMFGLCVVILGFLQKMIERALELIQAGDELHETKPPCSATCAQKRPFSARFAAALGQSPYEQHLGADRQLR